MDDAPEDLVGIVGRDGKPVEVLGMDLIAVRRRRRIPRRLEAQRAPTRSGWAFPDDQPARLVRDLGAGMVDHRLDDGRGDGGRRGTWVDRAHHQLTPPSRASRMSSKSVVYVPAERYFQPPSGSSATMVPERILRASRAAATSTAPHDGPPKMPSRKTSSRSAVSASMFDTRYLASSRSGSRTSGMKPSSSDRSPCTPSPGSGSAATMRTPGLFSRR